MLPEHCHLLSAKSDVFGSIPFYALLTCCISGNLTESICFLQATLNKASLEGLQNACVSEEEEKALVGYSCVLVHAL